MKENRLGMLLLSPVLLVLTALVIVPLLATIAFSFFDLRLGESSAKFIGLQNYGDLLASEPFWRSLRITFLWIVLSVIPQLALGTIIAVLLDRVTRFRAFLRGAIFLPWVIPVAVVAYMWQWLLTPETGLVSGIAGGAGLEGLARFPFLSSPDTAFATALIVSAWRGIPFVVIMVFAALQGISDEDYHAARVSGGNSIQCFVYVTLPYLKGLLLILAVIRTMQIANNYSLMALLTNGGPADSTRILPLMIYELAFREFALGKASALGVIALALTCLCIAFMMRRRHADN